MAKTQKKTIFHVILISFLIANIPKSHEEEDIHTFSRELSPKDEKTTHLHFFFHDTVTGENASAIVVAEAPSTKASATSFRSVRVMDDPLTVGPDRRSRQVGRAQGIYVSASKSKIALLMIQNYMFDDGKYNGSTLSVLGRNAGIWSTREFPVVGGTGVFRLARGFAQAKTHSFDLKSGYAIVEYNVYVTHYA